MSADKPARFTNPDAARQHLEHLRWLEGPVCPHCGATDKISLLKGKSTRPGVRWCNSCRKPFSVTVGTALEGSKIPLHIWLHATHLLCRKRHVSGHRLAQTLGVTYKTAWSMARHIRRAMTANL